MLTEASRLEKGSYPYNTFAIPFAVEVVKLLATSVVLVLECASRKYSVRLSTACVLDFFRFSIPAFCYFVSNNCIFYIIEQLGATTFQIMNNLKILSTAIFMNMLLARRLTWTQWKALAILMIGSMVTQLREEATILTASNSDVGYVYVVVSAVASGAGSVFTEKLLKGQSTSTRKMDRQYEASIHWQNVQLYAFGVIFGLISLLTSTSNSRILSAFEGFNAFAYAAVLTMAVCGLLVSFILKYLDNVAKCFCSAMSMLCVAIMDAAVRHEQIPFRVSLGMLLTVIALEQYHVS